MIHILQHNNPKENEILRSVSTEISPTLFGSQELKSQISQLRQALKQELDSVAISAPQIGISKRFFIVDPEIAYSKDTKWRPEVFINPVIVKASSKYVEQHEGCLSVRGFYGWNWRSKNITVEARDENGNKFVYGAGGLIAHIIQHEIDHLDGILFIDEAFDVEEDKDWKEKVAQAVKNNTKQQQVEI